jgi:Zn-dependent membrane protease YugP
MMFFDPLYLLLLAPALLLGMWAQWRVHSTYAAAQKMPAPLSGAAAARHILDSAGLQQVAVEEIPGQLSDHYDPREKVLRLSSDVYRNRTLAAVGIAAHESGHALQDAHQYAPLVVRNASVGIASFGGNVSIMLFFIGMLLSAKGIGMSLMLAGIVLFGAAVFFQLVNLPVEFNASARAKAQLVNLGIISQDDLYYVDKVLDAAAWTYVAATLQAVLTLVYLILRASGSRRD